MRAGRSGEHGFRQRSGVRMREQNMSGQVWIVVAGLALVIAVVGGGGLVQRRFAAAPARRDEKTRPDGRTLNARGR